MVKQTACNYFTHNTVDIIAVDPLRNVFDSGETELSENNNTSMLFFLQKRLEVLRQAINPNAGIILAHHTRKPQKKELNSDPFQTLSGASSLRSYYTTGALLFKENNHHAQRQLYFELRNGPAVKSKCISKTNGQWHEIDALDNSTIKEKHSKKDDTAIEDKKKIILNIIRKQALIGNVYTINQFCQIFDGKYGLGGMNTIRNHLNALASNDYVKFFKDATTYGIPNPTRTKFGYLCVKGMHINDAREHILPKANKKMDALHRVTPTHYKCKKTGNVMPIKDPYTWGYDQKEDLS